MKERRVFMTLALILGVLLLGVAYAAITTQNLNVTGNITTATSDANLDVRMHMDYNIAGLWHEPGFDTGEAYEEGSIEIIDDRNAVINIYGLTTKGDKVYAAIYLENKGKVRAKASNLQIEHSNPEWFKVEGLFCDDIGRTWNSYEEIEVTSNSVEMAMTMVWISVELLDTPATDAEAELATDTIHVTFDVDAIDDTYDGFTP